MIYHTNDYKELQWLCKMDFKTKIVIGEKEEHFIMMELIIQEDSNYKYIDT